METVSADLTNTGQTELMTAWMSLRSMSMTRQEIIEFLADHKAEMERRFGLEKIGLFGSYARDNARAESDIDIAVQLRGENLADNFFGTLHYLEDHLQCRIDLGLATNLRPEIREQVEKEIIYV